MEKFLSSARELQVNSELASAHRAVSTSLAMSRQRERVRRTTLNTKIQQLFLHLQGNILGDVSKHLNHKHRMFLKKEFLDSREPTAQAFYCSLLKTDLFHCFLKARLNRKSDAFTRWELTARVKREQGSQRPPPVSPVEIPRKSGEQSTLGRYNQLPGEEPGSERNAHQLQRRVSKFSGRSPQDKEVPRTLALPSFPANPLDYASVATYYTKLIDGISAEIEKAGAEAETLAVCFYLRGIVCLAQGRSLQALLDFQKLEKINMNFFPWELVKQTLEAMAPEQMREVHKTEVLKHLIYEMVEKHWDRARQEESVRNYELPKAPLNKQEFGVQIQAAGIINNSDTTDRLFDVLTGGQQKLVDPQTFTEFYTRWTEMKYDADSITLSAEVTKNLQETERISKVSNPVKTSCGLGRVAMTQKRLFLLTEGQPFYKEIARFRNIEEVESCLPVSVFPLKILALRIKVRDKKEPFVANLKSERDLWKLVIREMVAGKFLADRHKDPQYVQQALSNVQLINVVARCNLQQRPINMASKLASLTHSLGEEPPTVPRMTSEALKHTLHFPDSNSSLCSVDVLLYVPGSLDPEQGADAHPRLWCALSDGRVVMYNAATWVMDQSPVQAGRSRLNCMVSVGHEQVWVGSEDSSIYIIDAARVMCNRRLAGHRNQVSGMALEDVTDLGRATRQVYSCSLDGMVVLWDPEVQEVKSQFQLPQCWSLTSIAIHHNYLWCCVEYSLLVLSRDGLQLREVKFSPNPSSSSVLMTYFLIIPQRDELWTVSCQQSNLYIWKTDNPSNPIKTIPLPDCAIVVCMIQVKRQVWVGGGVTHDKTKGRIYVIDVDTYSLHKELEASCGLIRAMCSAEDRYILSGTQDSKAIIWKVD